MSNNFVVIAHRCYTLKVNQQHPAGSNRLLDRFHKTIMNQNDVLALFLEESQRPCRTLIRQDDSISLLAKAIADSMDTLSVESFEALVHIGGTMYKTWAAQTKARAELIATMEASIASDISNIQASEQY